MPTLRPHEEHLWLALCLISEDNEPHAYIPLAWAIRNRVDWPNNKMFLHPEIPESFRSVILREQQFSAFNELTDDERLMDDVDAVAKLVLRHRRGMYERWMRRQDDQLVLQAIVAADEVMSVRRVLAPFSHRVLYFYAPDAMPQGVSQPPWWSRAVWNTINMPGLTRWKFGEVKS